MFRQLKYIWLRFRFPGFQDFISMGLGIEVRYARCKRFWDKHLKLSKDFQQRALEIVTPGGRVAVLGAGRLLDVDRGSLCAKFDEIVLFDADPVILKSARRIGGKAEARISDLTGSIGAWTDEVQSFVMGQTEPDPSGLARLIKSLEPRSGIDLAGFRVLLSVNMLSQIPVYFRDQVQLLVRRYWGIKPDGRDNLPEPIQKALEEAMGKLQAQHLNQLALSGAERIIILSDQEFYYYTKEIAEWQVEPALYGDLTFELPGYRVAEMDSWFWHIAPQGIEEIAYGSIHKVVARAFLRDSGTVSA